MLTFLETNMNPNIILLRELVFSYCLGYFILKSGIHINDYLCTLCEKDLLGRLFFTQNHPQYRKLVMFMEIDRIRMPDIIRKQTDDMVGMKVVGKGCENDNVGEHFDFVIEYINNKIFKNLIWAPSKAAWILACRTYALLVGLTKSINTYLRCVR